MEKYPIEQHRKRAERIDAKNRFLYIQVTKRTMELLDKMVLKYGIDHAAIAKMMLDHAAEQMGKDYAGSN